MGIMSFMISLLQLACPHGELFAGCKNVVYFEDGVYCQGHFQSIVPTRKSETLEAILDEGGFDVADFLKLPDHGEFITVSSFKLLYY